MPLLVARTSSWVSRFATPLAVTTTRCSSPSATTVWMTSPRFVPNAWAAPAPRARPAPSASSAAATCRARPSEVTAVTVAVVRVSSEATSTSCRPGVARFAPAIGDRPIWPEVDRVTTHGSSSTSSVVVTESNTGRSSGWTISVRRGRPNDSTASANSSSTSVLCRFSEPRSVVKSRMEASRSSRSSSRRRVSSAVSRFRGMSRMWSVWSRLRSKRSMRPSRAVAASSEPRMMATTSSMTSRAMRRPATRWSRSSALASRWRVRRTTTSRRWSM